MAPSNGRLLIFGLGYTASAVAARLDGWQVSATGSAGDLDFEDDTSVTAAIGNATHILSSVPPAEDDPVLTQYGDRFGDRWLGYLSSTGVYGDTGGAWVDESAPIKGRREPRNRADADWRAMGARVFRLPGIYGPGRSPLDRVAAGAAHRTGIAGQVFSRIHVDDLARGVIAGFDAPPGAYNLADDLPAPQDSVVEFASMLLGIEPPAIVPLEALSPAARAFHAENRRVANGKAKRVLGWCPIYADYLLGLRALNAMTSPAPASTAPAIANPDQR
ncbi:NAD(P)-dependent oxidoreductase [Sphingomonas panacisoli]|uniref:NAD(P)-dependent oxidoreductase n=1 Tax=Sphingomonas panacisoli TaxID=1813879 RepID=A0A5B8LNK5_9SPHN|nr:NAD(P)-dependent oxidoreductase [Sphingomonas panacisoli]QDZ08952.1 NAD(P)-dependent oxidoreductase [Sphingomonas panacisoli]